MFRVVIADDEKYIVQLIRVLIDAERLGIEIVGEAYDGAEALEMVKDLRPDILITDIRMPSMDGLELIEQIRKDSPSIAVIAISGHRLFDYAYNAIKYGVEDFIVKPVNEKDLNDALEKVCLRLRGEQSASDHVRQLSEQTQQQASALRARFIKDLLSDAAPAADLRLEEVNSRYGLRFQDGDFTGLALWLDIPGTRGLALPTAPQLLEKCEKAVRQDLMRFCDELECGYTGGALCALLGTHGMTARDLLGKIKKLFENLMVELDAYSGLTVTIGMGPSVDSLAGAADSIRTALTCARVKCILGPQRIYQSTLLDAEHAGMDIDAASVRDMGALMEGQGIERVRSWLEEVFHKEDAYYRENPMEAIALGDAVIIRFQGLCEMSNIQPEQVPAAQRLRFVDAARSLTEFKEDIANYMEWVLATDYATRAEREAYPVVCAKAFMQDNLHEQIRLEDIARAAALSPSYLSVLFKKETGETVSDYLLRIRLEEAKRLLRTTQMNLNEIAACVGYIDAKHFSKMFRKQTGARPIEYRKLYAW